MYILLRSRDSNDFFYISWFSKIKEGKRSKHQYFCFTQCMCSSDTYVRNPLHSFDIILLGDCATNHSTTCRSDHCFNVVGEKNQQQRMELVYQWLVFSMYLLMLLNGIALNTAIVFLLIIDKRIIYMHCEIFWYCLGLCKETSLDFLSTYYNLR